MKYIKFQNNQQLRKLFIVSTYRHNPAIPSTSNYHRSERKKFALDSPDSVNHLAYLYSWLKLLCEPDSWLSQDFITVISEKRTRETGEREIQDWAIGNDIHERFLVWLEQFLPISLVFSFYETGDSTTAIWTVTVRLKAEKAVSEDD